MCARPGAPHLVAYAGYSGELLRSFLAAVGADPLVTCDGYYYEGETRELKPIVDGEPLGDTSALRHPRILDQPAVEVRHRSPG